MSDFTRELIPILVMYGFVCLLGPFIGLALWLAFDGDRSQVQEVPAGRGADARSSASPAPSAVRANQVSPAA